MFDSVNPTKFLCPFINIHSREQSTFMRSLALPLTPKCKVIPLRRRYYPMSFLSNLEKYNLGSKINTDRFPKRASKA